MSNELLTADQITGGSMKFAVVLENIGGVLDRKEFVVPDDHDDPDDFVDEQATNTIDGWVLSVGDTIKIVSVEA